MGVIIGKKHGSESGEVISVPCIARVSASMSLLFFQTNDGVRVKACFYLFVFSSSFFLQVYVLHSACFHKISFSELSSHNL